MAKWVAYVLFLYFAFTLPIVVPHLIAKYKAWRARKQVAWARVTESGEIIMHEAEEGTYFLAADEKAIPIMIDKEEGKRLWEQGKPI